MTTTDTGDTFCDYPGCGEWTDAPGGHRAGWTRKDQAELCPEHSSTLVEGGKKMRHDRNLLAVEQQQTKPPNYPVIVTHLVEGHSEFLPITVCTGDPAPDPIPEAYQNVPRYLCVACAQNRALEVAGRKEH